ncbi:putative Serine/threonine-protein kinase, active site [Blattamonas nauphoetae]|uniref:Serine/threonine-protein kinase, active site n=1 Tax=Blattamonas nauphoetae TaxID=2049346 RepID=A0ABQ9XCQ7_9EUKA|nr:putative Serine/threonine-protein kinase, active site [Blattamonas nauphoetae]
MGCGSSAQPSASVDPSPKDPEIKDEQQNDSLEEENPDIKEIIDSLTAINRLIEKKDLDIDESSAMKTSSGFLYLGTFKENSVVIKEINITLSDISPFLYEAEELLQLEHDGILRLEAVCVDPPMLVFPFYEKGNLQDHLYLTRSSPESLPRPKQLKWLTKLQYIIEIVQSLQHIHTSSPQHLLGCLTSPHILVSDDGHLVVGGFGCSFRIRLMTAQEKLANTPLRLSSLTWTAPELVGCETQLTLKMDAYALGIVMFEILFQHDPYEGISQKQIMASILNGNPIRPTIPSEEEYNKLGIPTEIVALMQECWDEIPENRPALDDMLEQLEGMLVNPSD